MTAITLNGSVIHTVGNLPEIGTDAPDFTATKTDLSDIHLKNYQGKRIILNIFPSLDTATCSTAMHKFNEIAIQFPDVMILCVSKDLPFAQKRFCQSENLANVHSASVFRHPDFGQHYGVQIIDGPLMGLLSRAVVIIDENGKIVYAEQVKEISNEPNYNAVKDALKHKSEIS